MELNPSSSPPSAPPVPTLVIDRRDDPPRKRPRRWFLTLVLIVSIFLNFVLLSRMGSSLTPVHIEEQYVAGDGPLTPASTKLAIVSVEEVIMGSNVDFIVNQIRQARRDTGVKGVCLRVETPGGTIAGSDLIYRELMLLRQAEKPLVVSMGGLAASGGYYVSMPAERIYAEPATLTGSIGVIAEFPDVHGLLEDHLKIRFNTIVSGKWKDAGSPFRAMTEEERRRWQDVIGQSYSRFRDIVSNGRGIPPAQLKTIADGRIFTAREAFENKLVDAIGYQDDALTYLLEKLNKPASYRVVKYLKPKGIFEALTGVSTEAVRPQGLTLDPQSLLKLGVPQVYYLAQ